MTAGIKISNDVSTTTKRVETDSLGQVELPANALYGINTVRAFQNFPFTSRSLATCPELVQGFAMIKQAAARANIELGCLSQDKGDAISTACDQLKAGQLDSHLIVDMLEGSGGTSTNMNFNEVIANAAALAIQAPVGDYSFIHPNDHVNMGQSTNDVHPSAMKLGLYHAMIETAPVLYRLADAFADKKTTYSSMLRLGRTCLQDAQPMTYGQLFGGYETVVRRHADQISGLREGFLILPLGGTAIGTGFGSRPGYKAAVYRHLCAIVGAKVQPADDPFDGMQNMDNCARLSAELRNTANSLSKIAMDLITLSSGPDGGIGEVALPPVQAGSSIMPGKVNPVIPMSINQIAFAVAGNDTSVAMACHQGMLEINHFEMVVCDRLLDSIHLLTRGAEVFRKRCIVGMIPNEKISYQHLLASSALATALVPALGYAQVSRLVHESSAAGRPFLELAIERKCLTQEDLVSILDSSVQVEGMSAATN